MPLTDTAIRGAKKKDKQYKISDERGMYLLVTKTGKYFRFDYRFLGKRKTLALGVYPDVTLKKARALRDAARQNIADEIDPNELKKVTRKQRIALESNSFEVVSREWVAKRKVKWTERHSMKVLSRLERDVFPLLGRKVISDINAPELLAMLRKVESRGATDTAHRIKQNCSQIFRYAIVTDRAERDPAADLTGALESVKKRNFAAITEPKQIAQLLKAIDGYSGSYIVKYALVLAPLLFARPGELRHAEWIEIDIGRQEWRIPAEKMKMRKQHVVPLSDQVIELIKELDNYTGEGKYLFPSMRTGSRPMSDNTINAALRRLGYSRDEMTCHGFRAMASTNLHEHGWPSDVIERQLAHAEGNSVKAVYNHAQHLQARRKMMQSWSDYLGFLRGEIDEDPLFYEL